MYIGQVSDSPPPEKKQKTDDEKQATLMEPPDVRHQVLFEIIIIILETVEGIWSNSNIWKTLQMKLVYSFTHNEIVYTGLDSATVGVRVIFTLYS